VRHPALSDPVVALELGSTTVRAVAAQAGPDGSLTLLGAGAVPSRGIRKSQVSDLEIATACAKDALRQLEESAGLSVDEAVLVVSGGKIETAVHTGRHALGPSATTIRQADVDHVTRIARSTALPNEAIELDRISQDFTVDNQFVATNPVGMEGVMLEARVLSLYGARALIRNVYRAANSAVSGVPMMVFSAVAAGQAVLSADEQERGVLLIDMGGGSTTYMLAYQGLIVALGSLAVGGEHVTNDLANGLRMTLADAEQLKCAHGSAMVDAAQRHRRVPISAGSTQTRRVATLGDVQLITNERVAETLQLVRKQIVGQDLIPRLGAGIVLTGGASSLKGMPQLAEHVFGLSARLGRMRDVAALSTMTSGPEFAAVVGAIRFAAQSPMVASDKQRSLLDTIKRLLGFGS